jgi:murein DD-endopeptidase MepM/ murein hydrolase activator NlpD
MRSPSDYPAWLDSLLRCADDPRILAWLPFTYDFSHPWDSFDVRPARRALEVFDWKHAAPAQPPPTQTDPATRAPSAAALVWPVRADALITQWYGDTRYFDYPTVRGHSGIDLAVAAGTPVRAAADAEVAYTGTDAGYGLYVRLWSEAWQAHFFYAHLSEVKVRVGDKVRAGQVIALSGNTGASSGAHLHYEVRIAKPDGSYLHVAGMETATADGRVDPFAFHAGAVRGLALPRSTVWLPLVSGPPASEPAAPSGFGWAEALAFALSWEGGFSDHPLDPGGATNQGVTLRAYTAWRLKHGMSVPTVEDLRNMPPEHRDALYFEDYWQPVRAGALVWPLSLLAFDTAILHGVGQAQAWIRESEGIAGRFMALRLRSYTKMKTFDVFGRGWVNRCAALWDVASDR